MPIVICDGSGFDLTDEINKHQIQNIEVLFFNNDIEKTKTFGKGYGEGEIVNYALINSTYLSQAQDFIKITGKLWVENIHQCYRNYNGIASFYFYPLINPNSIDTRFYICNINFFKENLSNAHCYVRDYEGIYLEHVFFNCLSSKPRQTLLNTKTPLICGRSGSMGIAYSTTRLKAFTKSAALKLIYFLSFFNLTNIK